MDTERNLLFGVLALQTGLIDSHQFIDCCSAWIARKRTPLANLLIERGWILPGDKDHVDYLLERKLQKHGDAVNAGLAFLGEDVKRSLASLGDADIERSLADLTQAYDSPVTTVSGIPAPQERYSMTCMHAAGGIGRVWLARDRHLGRDVAFKDLRPEHIGNLAIRARFLQEARITGQLEHPGIVPIYELNEQLGDRRPFYTMRFIKGRTLSEEARTIHRRRSAGENVTLDLLALLNAFVAVCNTLAYAHSCGVIHRDLKGQNVVLGDFGEVVVLDWGLAKVVDRPDDQSRVWPAVPDLGQQRSTSEPDLTVHGQALGTPAYMAPEQAAGSLDLIDHRTDIYGLGAVLYEILTGQPPFAGSDTREVLRKVQEEEVTPPRRLCALVPPALEAVCLRALAKVPADRYPSAAALAREVQHWQEFQRRQAEEALRASEALYHSLVETIPMNVWRKDADGRFTFGNRGFCETTKVPLSELIGKDDFDLFPRELAEKYRRDDRRILETGETLEITEEHLTAQGERLHVRAIKLPIFDGNGQTVGTQGIFWDAR